MKKAIQQDTLKALVSASALREARSVHMGRGWVLEVKAGLGWLPVRSRHEPVRVLASLRALGKFCDKIGINTLIVEL